MRNLRFIVLILLMPTLAIAQSSVWTIAKYEWNDQATNEKHIKPDQWINKSITFKGDTILFDFGGIKDFQNDINYKECVLLEPIDTMRIEDKKEFLFDAGEKYKACSDSEILVLSAKPNCYKFPFKEFLICDKKGFFELLGVLFIMKKE